jgi:hypothetical protein
MVRRVFVDTKWRAKKNRGSKMHVCYDPQNDVFFEVNELTELKDYDEIYLDSSLFPNMWQQLRELISNGRRVYYFTRPWKWEEARERFRGELKARTGKVSKSDEGDAYILWKIYELSLIKNNTHRYFKPLTIIDVELRPLLMREQMLYRNLQRVRSASIVGVDVGGDVKILEEMVEDARKEIVDKAIKIIPRFINIANSLGLNRDDINGLAGLAGLLVYDKFVSCKKSIDYLGLFKAKGRYGERNKKYSRKVQRYLIMLTNAILCKNGETRIPRYRDLREMLKKIVDVRKSMGLAGGWGWGVSPGKTRTARIVVLGEPTKLEARTVKICLWVARATKPAPPPKFLFVFSSYFVWMYGYL